jgi:hypothetical protein
LPTQRPKTIIDAADKATRSLLNDADRRRTHGDFMAHSHLAQSLKDIVRSAPGWITMEPDMQEALDMIMHKAARALVGDPRCIDHWADMSGYSALVADRLRKEAVDEPAVS